MSFIPARNSLAWIPWSLVGLRVLLGPVLLLLSDAGISRGWLAACVAIAFVSDVYDGVLARRLGVVTDRLRRADSQADVFFYLCVAASVILLHPDILPQYGGLIAGLLGLETLCQAINYVRFGRHTATHAYLCKFWAVLLCITLVLLFLAGVPPVLLTCTLLVGYLAYADVLVMICLLPIPAVDVPTSFHAWKLRRKYFESRERKCDVFSDAVS